MIAQLKYGAGTPFNRLEQLESQLGIPLPAATQWEIVEEEAQVNVYGNASLRAKQKANSKVVQMVITQERPQTEPQAIAV
jgi:hypothetical protein